MGIMYLAGYLRKRFDADFKLINQKLNNLTNDALVQAAVDFEADVVGLGAITPTAQDLPQLTQNLKRALPKSLVVIGGSHISAYGPKSLEKTSADCAVSGEGERAMEEVLRAHFDGGSLADVPGLFWRNDSGGVESNPGHPPLIENLDDIPFPAYDLIDLSEYWKHQGIAPIPRRKYVSLFSSRGCPYRCNYCHRVFGKGFRPHSAERMVDEVEYYQRTYGIEEIEFLDDIVNLDHDRLMSFCDLLHQRNIKVRISFPTAVRTDILRDDEIEALTDAGMYYCGFSLETGSARIQKMMGKNLNIDKFVENVNKVAAKRVYTNGFAMLGFPTETEEELKRTIQIACDTKLHTISFFTVTPFPGTDLYDLVMQNCPERLQDVSYDNMDFSSFNVNLSNIPDEVFYALQRGANRRFYMNPNRIMRIIRDYPKPQYLPMYVPQYLKRATKGMFHGPSTNGSTGGHTGAELPQQQAQEKDLV